MLVRSLSAFGSSVTLHLLAVVVAVWLAAPWPATMTAGAGRTVTTVIVAPPENSTYPGLNPVAPARDDWTISREDPASALEIGPFDVDVSTIGERARVLFPFVTPGLSLDHFALAPPREARLTLENPFAAARGAQRPGGHAAPPLVMTDAALQALVDKTWSRHGRWAAFKPIAQLVMAHSPDGGRLSDLLRDYGDQNALQPYADTSIRDPRLWAQLGLAADHVSFIAFIRRYASDHPSTRATTELLFLLDRIAEASRDALGVLLDNDPVQDLGWTRAANAKAYQLVARIRWYYKSELDRLGLGSEEAIDAHYDTVRLAILNGIVRTSPNGYRAGDARFLIGAIHWRHRRPEEALRWWRDAALTQSDNHVIASGQIAAALRIAAARQGRDAPAADPILRREIDRILKNHQGRWVSLSYDRLRRFGYRFDTF
jgi:hypothetical protein